MDKIQENIINIDEKNDNILKSQEKNVPNLDKNSIIDISIDEYSYGENKILGKINLNIKKGQCILISGLSGCGKTTLLRTINGLIPYFYEGNLRGSIYLNGKDISSFLNGEIAKYMGNVFQNPKDQFFSTIAEDEIALVGENLGMDHSELVKKVDQAISFMNLDSIRNMSVFDLSGGQRQRVAIASTLIYDTDVIIFDEPSASLDYSSIKDLEKALLKLKNLGKTIIIAEHRLYYLKNIFDKLLIMKDGKIGNIYEREKVSEDIIKENNLRCLDEDKLLTKTRIPSKYANEESSFDDYLEVKNLCVEIGKKCLIKDVNFNISRGECMAILGKNGIGKTSLSRQLSGLLPIRSGFTSYGKNKKERLKNSYFIMQDASSQLFSHTIEHELIPRNKLKDQEYLSRVKGLLINLDLWNKRSLRPQELSVGEKQRLTLILGLLSERKLLILDEPSAGLDFLRMDMVAKEIEKKKESQPIILITHDMELLSKVADTVLFLDNNENRKLPIYGNENLVKSFIKSSF